MAWSINLACRGTPLNFYIDLAQRLPQIPVQADPALQISNLARPLVVRGVRVNAVEQAARVEVDALDKERWNALAVRFSFISTGRGFGLDNHWPRRGDRVLGKPEP